MDDNVGSQIQRILEVWGQKGIIHDQKDVMLFCHLSQGSDICHIHHRIGRCLNVDRLGIWLDIVLYIDRMTRHRRKGQPILGRYMSKQTDASTI